MKKTLFIYLVLSLAIFITPDIKSNESIQIDSELKQLSAPEATSYQWFFNGNLLEGNDARVLSVKNSGTYTVKYTDNSGDLYTQTIMVSVSSDGVRKIILIGDSTCSDYASKYFPRNGWGQVFQSFFNSDSVQVFNYALSGRSSKSFYTDSDGWPKAMTKITKGDFLFIQFGHNDAKSDVERHTDPYTTYQDYLSIYIDTALARGAYPVLLTSIERNGWSGSTMKYSHGEYPAAMRELAAEKGIPLIDLTEKTHKRLEALGESYVTDNIYMNIPVGVYTTYPEGRSDNTHLQVEGAWEVCKLVKQGITEQKDTTTLGLLYNNMQSTGYVKVLSDPYLTGTFSGDGIFASGTETVVKANPSYGYAIAKWKIGGTVVSTEREFTYTVSDTMIFLRGVFDTGYKLQLNKTSGGSVTGAGSYVDGSVVTVYASPNGDYEFVGWVDVNSDTIETDTALTVTINGANVSYKAVFEEITTEPSSLKLDANTVLNIFPNPASDKIHLESDKEILNVQIININGKVLVDQSINSKSYTLPLTLPAGLFLIHVSYKDAELKRMIIIE